MNNKPYKIPLYIKIYSWFILILGIACIGFMFFGHPGVFKIFGLPIERNELTIGIFFVAIIIKMIIAAGLLTHKVWAIDWGYYESIFSMMSFGFVLLVFIYNYNVNPGGSTLSFNDFPWVFIYFIQLRRLRSQRKFKLLTFSS